jgi:GDPmannose 4,6-dehydratase
VSGILFNHESPHRGVDFVTRRITAALARWRAGNHATTTLGNINARRDWGFAGDYVWGIMGMMRNHRPVDLVLATGTHYSVAEFVEAAARAAQVDVERADDGYREKSTGQLVFSLSPDQLRPLEVSALVGDASLAEQEIGWRPQVDFATLVDMMVRADVDRVRRKVPLL